MHLKKVNKRDVIVCAHSRRTEPQTNKQTNILRVKSCINNPRPLIPSVLDTACVTASSVLLSYSTEGVTTMTVTGDNKQFVFGDNNLSPVVISQSHLPHQQAGVWSVLHHFQANQSSGSEGLTNLKQIRSLWRRFTLWNDDTTDRTHKQTHDNTLMMSWWTHGADLGKILKKSIVQFYWWRKIFLKMFVVFMLFQDKRNIFQLNNNFIIRRRNKETSLNILESLNFQMMFFQIYSHGRIFWTETDVSYLWAPPPLHSDTNTQQILEKTKTPFLFSLLTKIITSLKSRYFHLMVRNMD